MADRITFIRTDEQDMLATTLRDLLTASTDMDRTRELSLTVGAFDTGAWRAMAEMGLVGLALPEVYGGADSTLCDLAVVFEELGRVVAPVPVLSTVVASVAILEAGTADQHAALLPGIATGETIATLALFEDAHGTTTSRPETSATAEGSGWRILGRKRFVTDAPNAGLFVVTAAVDGGVGLFAIPFDTEGLTVSALPALDPTRPLGDVTLDVLVPGDSYLGDATNLAALSKAIDTGVVLLAQEQVGLARRCLEMSVDYARNRYQFGRAIGSFQAIKHRCADMLVAVEHARSVAWHAARTFDDPAESAIAVPLARSVCSDTATKVTGDTIQILGGIGFTWEHDAHLYFKRAKASSLLFGSIESHRDRLADALGV